ncbi:hypothetical protein PO909_021150 [Leuciscus waleckii]
MYAIVEFLEEGTCDLVTWLFEEDEVQYCYWPPINVTKKIKRLQLPDKTNWTRHRVRVFAKTGDYETAKKWSKRAAVQSSVESSDDVPKRKKRPVCLSSSDEDTPFKSYWRSKPWGKHPAGDAGTGLLQCLEGI